MSSSYSSGSWDTESKDDDLHWPKPPLSAFKLNSGGSFRGFADALAKENDRKPFQEIEDMLARRMASASEPRISLDQLYPHRKTEEHMVFFDNPVASTDESRGYADSLAHFIAALHPEVIRSSPELKTTRSGHTSLFRLGTSKGPRPPKLVTENLDSAPTLTSRNSLFRMISPKGSEPQESPSNRMSLFRGAINPKDCPDDEPERKRGLSMRFIKSRISFA
jgi:hypothetical protein